MNIKFSEKSKISDFQKEKKNLKASTNFLHNLYEKLFCVGT